MEKVAQRNACSTAELVDSVKTVALRSGKASFLSDDPLQRAIKKLKSESKGFWCRYEGQLSRHANQLRGRRSTQLNCHSAARIQRCSAAAQRPLCCANQPPLSSG